MQSDNTSPLIGAGRLWFDLYDSTGKKTGEKFFGNCTQVTMTTTDETTEKYASYEGTRPLIAVANKKRDIVMKIVGDSFDDSILPLLTKGEVKTVTQQSGTASDVVLSDSVKQGFAYALPHRKCSSVVVKANGTVVTSSVANYSFDSITNRIFVPVGSDIVDGDELSVSYSYAAESKKVLAGGTIKKFTAFLRYVADNTYGENKHLQVWKADLNPDGELGFVTDDWASWSLTCKILDDSANHPDFPYYQLETAE